MLLNVTGNRLLDDAIATVSCVIEWGKVPNASLVPCTTEAPWCCCRFGTRVPEGFSVWHNMLDAVADLFVRMYVDHLMTCALNALE